MRFQISRHLVLLISLFTAISFSSNAQNFEISQNVADSVSPTSYFFHISGYATFTDSMVMVIELRTNDTLDTEVYSAYKDFSTGGLNTLTNFTYDTSTEAFSLDIGTYTSLNYEIHVISKLNGVLQEDIIIQTEL